MKTKRLNLRPIEVNDAEKIVELWSDPRVTEHLGGPKDPQRIRDFTIEIATDPEAVFAEEGDRWWSVCLKDSGDWIGKCGLLAKEVEGISEIELSYFFLPAAWGSGYATEAAACLADHAFNELGHSSLIAIIDPDNRRSARVAERLGMALEKTIPRPGGVTKCIYRLLSAAP